MTLSELSRLTGVSEYIVRHRVRDGRINPARNERGLCEFSDSDARWVMGNLPKRRGYKDYSTQRKAENPIPLPKKKVRQHPYRETDVGWYQRELDKYNEENGTSYSYGLAVSLGIIAR